MEQKEFTYLLQNPATISAEQTTQLQEIIEQYPFFQTARAVRLKGLKNENSLYYNKELKITAAYTTDRSVLFDFITSEEFNQNQIADQIREQEHNGETEEQKPVEKQENLKLETELKIKLREQNQIFDLNPAFSGSEGQNVAHEPGLHLGSPLPFKREENHSFSEWLKLTKATPVQREQEAADQRGPNSRKFELIDEFIAKNPKINPVKSAKKANLAEENSAAPESLMTETLARVYLEQKNYKKAIQAYKILILKNPEKSGFFADQIRAINKLQEHNN